MIEAQLVLATLVHRVTFALVPGQTVAPEPLITLRPKHGIVIHRSANQSATAAYLKRERLYQRTATAITASGKR